VSVAGDVQTLRDALTAQWLALYNDVTAQIEHESDGAAEAETDDAIDAIRSVFLSSWRDAKADSDITLDRLAGELQRLQDAGERIERAWELCSWSTSTKAEIAATLLPGAPFDGPTEDDLVARLPAAEHALRGSEARRQAAVLALREAKVAIVATCDEGFDSTRREQALKGMAAIDAALAAAAAPPDGLTAEQAWGTDENGVVGDGGPGAAAPSGPEEVNEPGQGIRDRRLGSGAPGTSQVGPADSGSLTSPGGAPSGETP
jgi:hypothetical protein